MKRTLSLLVALALVFTMIPAVFAADNNEDIGMDELTQGMEIDNPTPAEIGKPYTTTWLTFTSKEGGEAHGVHYFEITADEDGNLELTVNANGTVALEGVTANVDGTYPVEAGEKYIVVVTKDAEATGESTWSATYIAPHVHAAATYTNNGDGTHKVTCECGEVVTASEDHNFVEGTCVCGAVEVIECQHKTTEVKEENKVSSTVTTIGSYEEVTYCTECGEELSRVKKDALLNPIPNSPIVLDNSLTIAFNVNYTTMDLNKLKDNGYYAIVEREDLKEGTKTTKIESKDWTEYTRSRYRVLYNDLPAKNMGDKVTIALYDSDTDERISEFYETSMRDLAMTEIETCLAAIPTASGSTLVTYKEQVTVFVDMLNYGAAAQSYFTYDQNNLVNADLSAEMLSYATSEVNYGDAIDQSAVVGYNNSNMILKSNIEMRLCYFADQFGGRAMGDVIAKVTYAHHNAPTTTLVKEINLQEWTKSGGRERWAVIVNWLKPADGNQLITIELCDKQDNVLSTAHESLNSILAYYNTLSAYAGVELWPAMNKFMTSAYNRFH